MTDPVYILGIDLSTSRLDCATLPDERSFHVPCSPAGFRTIVEHLAERRAEGLEVLAAVEDLGGSTEGVTVQRGEDRGQHPAAGEHPHGEDHGDGDQQCRAQRLLAHNF